MNLQIAILALVFGLSFAQQMDLVLLVELFRHGARTPICPIIPDDPWVLSYGYGELTPVGQREHFLLGQQLRENYKDFIPAEYRHDNIYIYSSNNNRIVESGISQLYGMFYKGGPDIPASYNSTTNYTLPPINLSIPLDYSDSALPFQYMTVPIHNAPEDHDFIVETSTTCANKEAEVVASKSNEEFEAVMEHYEYWIDELAEAFDFYNTWTVDTISFANATCMADYLISELYNHEEMPVDYPSELYTAATFIIGSNQYYHYNDSYYSNLFATGMIEYFQEEIENKINNPDSPLKLALLGGHDSNIANLMSSFGISNFTCLQEYFAEWKPLDFNCLGVPPYASSLIFELYQDEESTEEYYIKMKVNDHYYVLCDEGTAVDGYCPWKEIKAIFEEIKVDDFDSVCKDYVYEYEQTNVHKWKVITILVFVLEGLLLLAFLVVFLLCIRDKIITDDEIKEKKEVDL